MQQTIRDIGQAAVVEGRLVLVPVDGEFVVIGGSAIPAACEEEIPAQAVAQEPELELTEAETIEE